MSRYESKAVKVARSAEALAERFSDFTGLGEALNGMSAEERAKVGDVAFDRDTITITTPQVGAIRLRAVERTPSSVRLEAEGSPVPMSLELNFHPVEPELTEVTGALDVDIPMMLRPLVGPAMQKAVDQFGDLFAKLA